MKTTLTFICGKLTENSQYTNDVMFSLSREDLCCNASAVYFQLIGSVWWAFAIAHPTYKDMKCFTTSRPHKQSLQWFYISSFPNRNGTFVRQYQTISMEWWCKRKLNLANHHCFRLGAAFQVRKCSNVLWRDKFFYPPLFTSADVNVNVNDIQPPELNLSYNHCFNFDVFIIPFIQLRHSFSYLL